MHRSLAAFTVLAAVTAAGCGTSTVATTAPHVSLTHPDVVKIAQPAPTGTVLLVALDDGTVIKQTIFVDADICFKQLGVAETTCFIEGAPIYDPATDSVIGYEMIEKQIELIGRFD